MRNTIPAPTLFDDLFRDLTRVAIGFEPTIKKLQDVHTQFTPNAAGYPPYDLELIAENEYKLTLAVAGFTLEDLDIETYDNQLVISGNIRNKDDDRKFLYRGIANRSFKRVFHLEDHIKIVNANLSDGLLTIDLVREIPESMKPRKIAIAGPKLLDADLITKK